MAPSDITAVVAARVPGVSLVAGDSFKWSPSDKAIYYPVEALHSHSGIWGLIHEAAHSLLGHASYTTDFELLCMERAAWDTAKELAKEIGKPIEEDHIEDCLDTYRDWLHRRSTCPTCGCACLQQNRYTYSCHNCTATWNVSPARFCRPYRLLQK